MILKTFIQKEVNEYVYTFLSFIAVYVFYGNAKGEFSIKPDVTIFGDNEGAFNSSHIGYALKAEDINGDGLKDLVIGNNMLI